MYIYIYMYIVNHPEVGSTTLIFKYPRCSEIIFVEFGRLYLENNGVHGTWT